MDNKDSESDIDKKEEDQSLIDRAKAATRENKPAEALELYEEEIQNLIQEIKDKSLTNDRRSRLKRQCSEYLSMAEVLKMEIGHHPDHSEDDEDLEHLLDDLTNLDSPDYSLNDVCGCQDAIDKLKESVILPCKFPQLFKGQKNPWKGILLYGAPGTGKTMIGRALSKEDIGATFIRISATDLISTYVDSERLIKKLFRKARSFIPCIIFLDDYEQLFTDACCERNHHVITELSVQIQGVGQESNGLHVILSACKPWNIPRAVLRRLIQVLFNRVNSDSKPCVLFVDDFEQLFDEADEFNQRFQRLRSKLLHHFVHMKDNAYLVVGTLQPWKITEVFLKRMNRRIYLPLPDREARKQMIKNNLKSSKHNLKDSDFSLLADKTEGYTGADISVAIRDALMEPVRRIQSATHFKKVEGPSPNDPDVLVNDLLTPCASTDSMAIEMSWKDITDDKLNLPMVSMEDVERGFDRTLPSISKEDIEQYEDFASHYSTEKTIDGQTVSCKT